MPLRTSRAVVLILLLAGLAVSYVLAQRYSRQAAPIVTDDNMHWENDPKFAKDVFTFVRIRYTSGGYGRWRGWGWDTDYPDAELNFSFRLQQLTSLKVHPEGKVLELTDKELFDYPWIYIVEPGAMSLSEQEVRALRQYLLSGGFLMVDDFWGEQEWDNLYHEMKRVFPDREPSELPPDHPIFHCVFPLKEKPQIPNYRTGTWAVTPGSPSYGVTWERPDAQEVHYRALYDDKGRMMAIICHNTDLGDGWEREGENHLYFREFAEKKAYPLGINIVFYAMTH